MKKAFKGYYQAFTQGKFIYITIVRGVILAGNTS